MQKTDLRDLAVLVSLRLGSYGSVIQDTHETEKLNATHGAKAKTHKVSRDRLAGTQAGSILESIRKAQGEVRAMFNARTLPWDDRGRRMCGNLAAAELWQELGTQRARLDSLVTQFLDAWQFAETEARAAMNGAWRPEFAADYKIGREDMRARFAFVESMESMPTAEDIRIDAPAKMIEAARMAAEREMQERFREGCRDAYTRLAEAIEHMHAKLADPEATYRDSLFGNLRELVDLLPALNIAQDPKLTAIGEAAQRRLLSFDLPPLPGMTPPPADVRTLAQRARDDVRFRQERAQAAGAILDDLRMALAA